MDPSPSEGYEVVFECAQQVQELCVFTSNSEVVRLAPGVQAMDPSPSPDGKRIAFVAGNVIDGTTDIFVMNRDGSAITQLTFDVERDDQPAWSPDGLRIAFRSFRTQRDGDIWVMNADGSNQVNLTPDPLPAVIDMANPAWSPVGRIAFSSNEGGTYDIWTMNGADGTDRIRVTNTSHSDAEPIYVPNGSTIIFRRVLSDGTTDIAFVPTGGGNAIALARDGNQGMPSTFPESQGILTMTVYVSQETPTARSDILVWGIGPLVSDQVPGGSTNPAYLHR